MATASYVRTIESGREPDTKAVSIVLVDGKEVRVSWWPSLLRQWGEEGVRAYLEAEALFALGHYEDARNKLAPLASGSIDAETGQDTRNWAQRWIDEHPDPITAAL